MTDPMQPVIEVLARALCSAAGLVLWEKADEPYRNHWRVKATALLAEIEPLIRAEERAKMTPDYCYDPVDWEYTIPWSCANDLADSALWQRDVARICTLVRGPDKWAIWSADRDEILWFDTEEQAVAAIRQRGNEWPHRKSAHGRHAVALPKGNSAKPQLSGLTPAPPTRCLRRWRRRCGR